MWDVASLTSWEAARERCSVRAEANCPVCLQSLCFPPRSTEEETTSAMTPNPRRGEVPGGMKAQRRGGRAATCGRLVWGKPNGLSLIGRAICHSWDGLRRRILPLKGNGETGTVDSGRSGWFRGEEPKADKPAPELCYI